MSYRILIVDDEAKSLDALEWKLSQVDTLSGADITRFTRSKEALKYIKEHAVDLVFLDINMPNLDGLELADLIHDYQEYASIIFTTGYDAYHLEALRLSAVDYLQKPFDLDDLQAAVKRFINKREQLKYNAKAPDGKLAIHHTDGILYVEKKEIAYCSSESNYSYIHLKNGEKILTSKTLKYHEAVLGKSFFRVHNQYLVNLNCIIQYHKGSGGSVEVSEGSMIPVARRKKEELLILLGA